MKAIIKVAGKQYIVKEGDTITVEKNLETAVGKKVEINEVLAVGSDNLKFGSPFVKGAKVIGEVLKKGKDEKVTVFKFKKRKRYHRTRGHRQEITEVKITKIEQ
ncbi:MAG: 50S ribosomal protein L21 [Candidatus Ratteibacteria bacterium]|nr:50S ribosomal protein L21 [Candidatus Ratteibacteria bacterium]